jgi:hypothetical protein
VAAAILQPRPFSNFNASLNVPYLNDWYLFALSELITSRASSSHYSNSNNNNNNSSSSRNNNTPISNVARTAVATLCFDSHYL